MHKNMTRLQAFAKAISLVEKAENAGKPRVTDVMFLPTGRALLHNKQVANILKQAAAMNGFGRNSIAWQDTVSIGARCIRVIQLLSMPDMSGLAENVKMEIEDTGSYRFDGRGSRRELFGYGDRPHLGKHEAYPFCFGVEVETRSRYFDSKFPSNYYARTGWLPTNDTTVNAELKSPPLWMSSNFRMVSKIPDLVAEFLEDPEHKSRPEKWREDVGGHISLWRNYPFYALRSNGFDFAPNAGSTDPLKVIADSIQREVASVLHFPLIMAMYEGRRRSGYCRFQQAARGAISVGLGMGRVEHRYFPAVMGVKQLVARMKLVAMMDTNVAKLEFGMSALDVVERIYLTNNPIRRLLAKVYSPNGLLKLFERSIRRATPAAEAVRERLTNTSSFSASHKSQVRSLTSSQFDTVKIIISRFERSVGTPETLMPVGTADEDILRKRFMRFLRRTTKAELKATK